MALKKTEQQKALEHDCDGKCYWSTGMCPRVEYCEETRKREWISNILAILTIVIGIPLFLFVIFAIILFT